MKAKLTWVMLLGILLIFSTQPAAAHGYIVRAIPEDRSTLERAPTRVQYWFSEPLEPDFSSVNVRDQNGTIIATGGITEENNAMMIAQLPPDLPDGAYIVELRPAFASDGHVVAESRVFFVGSEVSGVNGSAASDAAIPFEVIWRAVSLTSAMMLFGVFSVYAGILVPAWGSHQYPAGLLPPRVMRRIYALLIVGLVIFVISSITALIQQSMSFFNTGAEQVISQGLWNVVRIGSRFGDVWNFRMIFAGLAAAAVIASLYFRASQPQMVRPFLTSASLVMALLLGTFSAVSHAAGSQILPWVGVMFDWLHANAVGFWVGGIIALVFILPAALKPYSGEQRRLALLAVLRRFSRWAMASLAIVITTGVYNSSTWIDSPSTAQSTFGVALAAKLVFVALMVGLGALHHAALRPERYARLSQWAGKLGGLNVTLRLEAVIGVIVLASAGLVTATPVPVPDYAQTDIPVPTDTVEAGDYTVTMQVIPGGPGINTFDAVIRRDGQPPEGITASIQNSYPSLDLRGDREPLENVEAGLYVNASGDFDRTGEWWSMVDIRDEDGTITRAAFRWDIRAEASIIETRPPTLINLAAIAATLIAIMWALSPSLKRFYAKQDINPFTVSVGLWALTATVIFAIAGYVIVTETQRSYQATLTPPPQVVNTVLPDQESLTRGAQVFSAQCAGWEGQALEELRQRLERSRDDELYRFTQEGWRSLPACGTLDESQRWDVVNYLRTLEPVS